MFGFTLKSFLDQLRVGLLQLVKKKLSLSSPLAIATEVALISGGDIEGGVGAEVNRQEKMDFFLVAQTNGRNISQEHLSNNMLDHVTCPLELMHRSQLRQDAV